ncbi:MAG: argininosuccinate lyase [Gemmatimonadales bacterium]|nr:MAG: argininosuccinate lyase [Gemmatimonadales bacterium]
MSDGSETPQARKGGLWGGRFSGGMAPEMEPLNRSLDVDRRLWREDLEGSRAWARALGGAGVLDPDEVAALLSGLDRVSGRLSGQFPGDAADEDIHSLVERLLREEAGAVAGKLHTGRSRNDQVSTDFRLWGMKAAGDLEAAVAGTVGGLVDLAERGMDVILPGYTHLQQGQPVRAAHWALSHAWPLLRDAERLRRAGASASVLPLGSGALAGCPFPVDREALARELGFTSISENSMDAVSDRDWAAELLFAGALLGVHLSRLSEDLLLFSSKEFGFIRIGDGYSTGSSLMPQKRNPDVAELVRGKSARLTGGLMALLTLLKGLPTGYNRDLQEDKSIVFDAVDTLALVLPAMGGALRSTEFRPDRIEAARDTELLATDLADVMVRAGVPFREAHDHVGTLVRLSEEGGVPLSDLPDQTFAEVHPTLGDGAARAAFDWEKSVEARAAPGGTARARVRDQLDAVRRRLDHRTDA